MMQALEERQYSDAARFDRFDGFDRGDLDYDYDEKQRCKNEEAEEEMRREAIAHLRECGYSAMAAQFSPSNIVVAVLTQTAFSGLVYKHRTIHHADAWTFSG